MSNNIKKIQSTFKEVNKKNLAIQSFLMVGFTASLVYSFSTPYAILPGMLFGANLPQLLLEYSSFKFLKKNEIGKKSIFSKNHRYNKYLKNRIEEYLNNSTSELEKKYKTFYLTLWSDIYAPYNINSSKMIFKDVFLFQSLMLNIKLIKASKDNFKEEQEENERLEKESNFFIANKINNYKIREELSNSKSNIREEFLDELREELNNATEEQLERIKLVNKDFEEFGFLSSCLLSSLKLDVILKNLELGVHNIKRIQRDNPEKIEYIKKLSRLGTDYPHQTSSHINALFLLQDYTFSKKDIEDFKTVLEFDKNTNSVSGGFFLYKNFNAYISLEVFNKIDKNNSKEDMEVFIDFIKLTELKIKVGDKYLDKEETESLLFKRDLDINLSKQKEIAPKKRTNKI